MPHKPGDRNRLLEKRQKKRHERKRKQRKELMAHANKRILEREQEQSNPDAGRKTGGRNKKGGTASGKRRKDSVSQDAD